MIRLPKLGELRGRPVLLPIIATAIFNPWFAAEPNMDEIIWQSYFPWAMENDPDLMREFVNVRGVTTRLTSVLNSLALEGLGSIDPETLVSLPEADRTRLSEQLNFFARHGMSLHLAEAYRGVPFDRIPNGTRVIEFDSVSLHSRTSRHAGIYVVNGRLVPVFNNPGRELPRVQEP